MHYIYGPAGDGSVQAVVGGKDSDFLTDSTLAKRLRRQTSGADVAPAVTINNLKGDSHDQLLVHWSGHPSQVLFALTRRRDLTTGRSLQSWLWRSTDNGKTVKNENSKFGDNALIEWYYISPDENKLIFTDVLHQTLYITVDEGDSYTKHVVPFVPDKLTFQSQTTPNYQGDSVLGYDSTIRSLYVSRSLGMNSSWIPLCASGVTRYFWGVLGPPLEQDTTVYFEVDLGNNSAILKQSSSPFLNVEDFPQLGTFLPNSFYLTFQYMFVKRNGTTGSPLWVSYLRGPFQQASFPGLLPEMYYMVVDASEGQVFMAVYHNINTSSLYISDQTGRTYSLSLEGVVSSPASMWMTGNPKIDIHPVEGLYGTYLANMVDTNTSYGLTVITFNKGGVWQRLAPPTGSCSLPGCSVHLRMDFDIENGYQSILTQDSAIGFIMALGNLGPTLISDPNTLGLYFSNDGGTTWQGVKNGYWQFQFVGQGSIIVAIPKWSLADLILWSCDGGTNWHTDNLPEELSVVGMFTEPGEKSLHASVFGHTHSEEWVLVDLDFSFLTTSCSPYQYSPWQRLNQTGAPICVLGEMVSYERRRPGVCCLIDPDCTMATNRSTCLCSSEDFECDAGFWHTNLDGPCTPVEGYIYPPPPPTNCPQGTSYNFTSGYRRIPGDRCEATDKDMSLPVVVPCPTNIWNMSTSVPSTSTSSSSIPSTSTSTSVPSTSTSVPSTSTSSSSIPSTSTSTSVPSTSSSSIPSTSTSTSVPSTSTSSSSIPSTSTSTSVPNTSTSSSSIPSTSTSTSSSSGPTISTTSSSIPSTSTSTSVPNTSTSSSSIPSTSTSISVPSTSISSSSIPNTCTSISVPSTSTSSSSIPSTRTSTSVPSTSTSSISVPSTSTSSNSIPSTSTSIFVPGTIVGSVPGTSTSVPSATTVPAVTSLELTVGLGVGIPLALLMAVVASLAFVYCKRTYGHSHANYSRLQQSSSLLDDMESGERELVDVNDMEREEERSIGQSEELFDDGSGGSELKEIANPESLPIANQHMLMSLL